MIGRNRQRTAAEPMGPLPAVGDALWIENTAAGPLQSRALAVRDGLVCLDVPRSGGKEVSLPSNVTISYQVNQVPCEAKGARVAAPAGGEDGLWIAPASITRIQRRRAVRVPVVLMARLLDDDDETAETGVTEDLSANGVLLRLTEPVEVGSAMRIVLHLGGSAGDIDTVARVVRVDKQPESTRPWRVAMTFPDLGRALEDRVVRFLFERQRELRRREGGD